MAPWLNYIPEEGDFEEDDFYYAVKGGGECKRCNKSYVNLKDHWREHHSPEGLIRQEAKKKITVITTTDVPEGKVTKAGGQCNLCKNKNGGHLKLKSDLRKHFIAVHLKKEWICDQCGKRLTVAYKEEHILTHSDPVRCEEPGCGTIILNRAAAIKHFERNHHGTKVNVRDLTPEENEQRMSPRDETKRYGGSTYVPNIATHIMNYEKLLGTSGSVLNVQAKELQEKFEEFFDFSSMSGIQIIPNANFITVWRIDWRTPLLVFERVPRTEGKTPLYSNTFCRDPKLEQIPGSDLAPASIFSRDGFHRGHMAPGLNYRTEVALASTYYSTNFVLMMSHMNVRVRPKMETFIREEADRLGYVYATHFLIMESDPPRREEGIAVADSVATVMMTEGTAQSSISAWDLPNTNDRNCFSRCVKDPFRLFAKGSIPFQKNRGDYDTINPSSTSLPFRLPPSTATSSSSTSTTSPSPVPLHQDSDSSSPYYSSDEAEDESSDSNGLTFPIQQLSSSSSRIPFRQPTATVTSSSTTSTTSPSPSFQTLASASASPCDDDKEESSDSEAETTSRRKTPPLKIKKRSRIISSDSEDSDDGFGPSTSSKASPPKKRATLSQSDYDSDFKDDRNHRAYIAQKKSSSSSSASTSFQSIPNSSSSLLNLFSPHINIHSQ